ncbi:hypothetical protein HY483_00170 [Candidatus Woesearchaeota archaeon]|nr:hypothetical protein [Candidatus Woesearchaeota archaeon]
MRKLFFVLLLLFTVGVVSASVDVPYSFNVDNVDVVAVDCFNGDCSSARDFSGSFPGGSATSDGSLTVRFPDSLATSYGYGILYFAKGFLPKAYVASWNNNGHSDVLTSQPFSIDFEKKPVCNAHVDNFEVVDVSEPNIPLRIFMDASLDADVHSAFSLTKALAFIPSDKKQEFYGVDTVVSLKVLDEGKQLVYSSEKKLSADNNNALLVDSSQRIEFSWTPKNVGKYTILVSTRVVDDQCVASEDSKVSKELSVLSSSPKNVCYSLLNSADFSKKEFVEGEKASFSFTALSSRADENGVISPLQSDVSYVIRSPSGKIVDGSLRVPASSTPLKRSVEFLASEKGVYSVSLIGTPWTSSSTTSSSASSSSTSECSGLSVLSESLAGSVLVVKDKKFDVNFQVVNAVSGSHVNNARVLINGFGVNGKTLSTGSDGRAVFSDLSPGKYSYTISSDGFESLSGFVNVQDFDLDIFLSLVPVGGGKKIIVDVPSIPAKRFSNLFIEQARTKDEFSLSSGDSLITNVVITNDGSRDETVRVVAYSLSLPAISSSRTVTVPGRGSETVQLSWKVPESAGSGKHWYNVAVWSDVASTNAHRFVRVK